MREIVVALVLATYAHELRTDPNKKSVIENAYAREANKNAKEDAYPIS
jgi:hypothetical protein